MWWTDLALGPKIAVIIAMVITSAVVVGFVLHWIHLFKVRKK